MVKVITVPDGKDPDEFVKRNGAEAFRELTKKAKSVIEYKLYVLEKKFNLSDNTQKAEFASEASKIIAQSKSDVERDLYSKVIAEKTGISSSAVETQVRKNSGRNEKREKREIIRESVTLNVRKKGPSKLLSARRKLISLFAFDKKTMAEIPQYESLFESDVHKKLVKRISEGEVNDPAVFMTEFSGDDVAEAAAALSQPVNYEDNSAAAREIAAVIKKEKINELIEKSMKDGDLETLNRLIKEKNNL